MPVAVFTVGCAFGTDRYNWRTMANMLLVTLGVAIASYGEAVPHGGPRCSVHVTAGPALRLPAWQPALGILQ
jgi:hypothetical protein